MGMIMEVKGLVAAFNTNTETGKVRAVDGASFDLMKGETLGIVESPVAVKALRPTL